MQPPSVPLQSERSVRQLESNIAQNFRSGPIEIDIFELNHPVVTCTLKGLSLRGPNFGERWQDLPSASFLQVTISSYFYIEDQIESGRSRNESYVSELWNPVQN